MKNRITQPGSAEMVRLRLLLRELRRHIQTYGAAPRIDSTDAEIQQSWIGLCRLLEKNASDERQRIRRELRGAA